MAENPGGWEIQVGDKLCGLDFSQYLAQKVGIYWVGDKSPPTQDSSGNSGIFLNFRRIRAFGFPFFGAGSKLEEW